MQLMRARALPPDTGRKPLASDEIVDAPAFRFYVAATQHEWHCR